MTFLGAAGTVTGSKYLLTTTSGANVLVDCGLFQGPRELRRRNWDPLPVDGGEIDAVLLTHAHVDHCGHLPLLVRSGFSGPVLCTGGTADLARIVLPDSGHLHEEEAAFANRVGYSKHHPALPLYTEADALASLDQLVAVPFDTAYSVVPGVSVTWRRAGHILGAAWLDVQLDAPARRIVLSGDLGRDDHPLLLPPERLDRSAVPVDVAVCESTYGDEEHPDDDVAAVLADAVTRAAKQGGVIVIPAFAVDRTEVVLHHLDVLVRQGRVPELPVFVDSPMASAALRVYRREALRGSPEVRPEFHGGPLFEHVELTETRSVEESKALNDRHGPMIIVSASGMAAGGRVLHHLAARLGDPHNIVMLVGFQAPGTRGEALAAGARSIKLLGAYRPVRAEVRSLPLSSHADRSELLTWLGSADAPPSTVYVTHGEPAASDAFARSVADELGSVVVVPDQDERIRLDT